MVVAEVMLSLFIGRADYTAVEHLADGKSAFHPEPVAPSVEAIERHLSGEKCIGFYLLDSDSKVRCSCADLDSKPERPDPDVRDKAERLYFELVNVGCSPLVEISQSGQGVHVWLFFSEPVDAWLVRAWWRGISERTGIAIPEVYPRQDRLTGKGLGNLVRFPLWNESRFADPENEWADLDPLEAMQGVSKSDAGTLKLLAWELGLNELKPESPLAEPDTGTGLSARVRDRLSKSHTLVSRRWFGDKSGLQDQSRSALLLSIACELVRTFVPTPEIESAVRYWCEQNGYEKGERPNWIQDTVKKAYDFVTVRVESKSRDATTMKEACLGYLERVKAGTPMSIPSGVRSVDDSIEGVGFGEMAIIAARPSHGKSAFGLQWLDSASANNMPCLIISEEMSEIELGRRGLLYVSNIEELDWSDSIDTVRGQIVQHYNSRASVYVVSNCSTIDRAEEVIDQFCSIYGVGLVAVDYLQLLGGRGQKRYDDVTEVSRKLKQAASRNHCAMLVMCQLNREIEKRDGFVPKNSDLRESGQIEQDADLIMFVQWPIKFDPRYKDPDEYRIYITKNRNGAIKQPVILTRFNPNRQIIGGTVSKFEPWDGT